MGQIPTLRSDGGQAVPALALFLGGAALAGMVIGAVLGAIGGVDVVGEPARVAAATHASYFDCPDGGGLGQVTRGDRVFITGRDASGQWVQVRSPNAVSSRSWIRAIHVLPDEALGDLPVLSCGVEVEAIVEAASTTTTVPDTTSTTTTPTTTSTTTTTTTTTVAPPSVGTITSSEDPIWESYFEEDACNNNPDLPAITLISASVSAPAGVQTVILSWSVDGEFGSIQMSLSGGMYRATLGPFQAEDPSVVPMNGSLEITITVEVTDSQQRQASDQITVTLNDCTFG